MAAAIVAPQSSPKAVWNVDSHRGSVWASASLLRMRTIGNSFHAVMKPKSEVAIRPGASSGKMTLTNAWVRVQPSTIADSSSSLGTAAT